MAQESSAEYDMVAVQMTSISPATRGMMFGMPVLKYDGKAFAGYHKGAMAFKLNGLAHAEALALPGARLFDPSGRGRPMREWVEVPAAQASRWSEFAQEALRYLSEGRLP
jgi:hypothetical protein